MSIATTNTQNTMGVRHMLSGPRPRSFKASRPGLHGYLTLGSLGSAPDPDTLNALVAAGYDPIALNALVQQGASDEQLLALPYGPGTTEDDRGNGVYNLSASLHGAPPPAGVPASQMQTSAVGSVYGAGSTLATNAGNAAYTAAALTPPGLIYTGLTNPGQNPLAVIASNAGAPASLVGPTQQPAPPAAAAQPGTLLAWFETNAIWIALLAGAAIVLPPMIKKL